MRILCLQIDCTPPRQAKKRNMCPKLSKLATSGAELTPRPKWPKRIDSQFSGVRIVRALKGRTHFRSGIYSRSFSIIHIFETANLSGVVKMRERKKGDTTSTAAATEFPAVVVLRLFGLCHASTLHSEWCRHQMTIYRGGNKGLYVVARNFFLLLLNSSAWPCLGPA